MMDRWSIIMFIWNRCMWNILIQQSVELVAEGAPATEHLGATQLGTIAPLSSTPASSCHSTKEDLLNAKLNVVNVCPLCLEFGVRCYVGSHPLAVSGKSGASSFIFLLNDFDSINCYIIMLYLILSTNTIFLLYIYALSIQFHSSPSRSPSSRYIKTTLILIICLRLCNVFILYLYKLHQVHAIPILFLLLWILMMKGTCVQLRPVL